MRHALLILAGTLASATPAWTQTHQTAAGKADATQQRIEVVGHLPKEKKICESNVATGSILRTTVCKTADQWALERERGLATIHEISRRREFEDQVRLLRAKRVDQ